MNQAAQQVLDALDGVAYATDGEGCIHAIGWANWSRFAEENDGHDLVDPASVIGRKLLDFVSGDEVKAAFAGFLDQLRVDPRDAIAIPFRCDSPGSRRDMRLAITVLRNDRGLTGFLFQSITLDAETRPPINLYDFRALRAALDEYSRRLLLRMCSYCQRVVFPAGGANGEWIVAEDYYRRGGISDVRISHGICPECDAKHVQPNLPHSV